MYLLPPCGYSPYSRPLSLTLRTLFPASATLKQGRAEAPEDPGPLNSAYNGKQGPPFGGQRGAQPKHCSPVPKHIGVSVKSRHTSPSRQSRQSLIPATFGGEVQTRLLSTARRLHAQRPPPQVPHGVPILLVPAAQTAFSHWQVVVLRVWLMPQVGAGFPGPPHAKQGPVSFVP